jgi:hypothetical protein
MSKDAGNIADWDRTPGGRTFASAAYVAHLLALSVPEAQLVIDIFCDEMGTPVRRARAAVRRTPLSSAWTDALEYVRRPSAHFAVVARRRNWDGDTAHLAAYDAELARRASSRRPAKSDAWRWSRSVRRERCKVLMDTKTAAMTLGISRHRFYRLRKRFGVEPVQHFGWGRPKAWYHPEDVQMLSEALAGALVVCRGGVA